MTSTTTYLTSLTVKVLRTMAKDMGLTKISRLNKADLVQVMADHMEILHMEADAMGNDLPQGTMADKLANLAYSLGVDIDGLSLNEAASHLSETYTRTNSPIPAVSTLEMPALNGEVVMEAHARYCRERGHAIHKDANGTVSAFCPRCGDNRIEMSTLVIDTPEFPMDHSQFVAWYRRFESFEAREAIEFDHAMALKMNVNSVAKDMISEARKAIKALTPTLSATKRAFEGLRDNEGTDAQIEIAYQIFLDTHRAIEEYTRSIAYIAGDHECMNSYSEIGLTDECNYGCKIYRCAKCQDETVLHNATYGCRQNS
jgi:predicted Zn-ribbon and HTH transcriptional regulator